MARGVMGKGWWEGCTCTCTCLVEVGEGVGVGGERVVRVAIEVAHAAAAGGEEALGGRLVLLPEGGEVSDEERRDVVGVAAQVARPEALVPEAEAPRVLVGVVAAKGRHGDRVVAEGEVPPVQGMVGRGERQGAVGGAIGCGGRGSHSVARSPCTIWSAST